MTTILAIAAEDVGALVLLNRQALNAFRLCCWKKQLCYSRWANVLPAADSVLLAFHATAMRPHTS
jgi:hypothetical protein